MNISNALVLVCLRKDADNPLYLKAVQIRRTVRNVKNYHTSESGDKCWSGTVNYKGAVHEAFCVTRGDEQVERLPWVLNIIENADNNEAHQGGGSLEGAH